MSNKLIGVSLAHNEPDWILNLKFGGASVITETRHRPDLVCYCNDGAELWIERKSPSDLLSSLLESGNYPEQMAELAKARSLPQVYPYLVITGDLIRGQGGKVVAEGRQTQWGFASVQGALLLAQELGVFVYQCGGEADFEQAVIRLASRSRETTYKILPAKLPRILGREFGILDNLGIGPERAERLLSHYHNLGELLTALIADTYNDDIPVINSGDRTKIARILFASSNLNLQPKDNHNA